MSYIDIYREIVNLHSRGEIAALSTIVKVTGSTPGKLGFKMLVCPNGKTIGTVGGGRNEAKIIDEAVEAINMHQPRLVVVEYEGVKKDSEEPLCGGSCEIFIEPILPARTLYIFGAGHIGQSLYNMSKILGFRTIIIDDREEFANKNNFPEADSIMVTDFKKTREIVKPLESSYVVIATRGHDNDYEVLRSTLELNVGYIGMIGSKKKVQEIFRSLEIDGVSKALLEKVHAPIGLDLGAKTPAEIAVSIIAEIISIINQRSR